MYATLIEEIDRLKAINSKLRSALVGLVGCDGDELEQMESIIQKHPTGEEDQLVILTAVRVLRETYERPA